MRKISGEMVDAALLAYWGPRRDGRPRQWTVGERQGMRQALVAALRVRRKPAARDAALFIEGAITDAYASGWRPHGFGGVDR